MSGECHCIDLPLIPGVMKSAMGELTDTTNRADAFALMPVVWAFGATMGYVPKFRYGTNDIGFIDIFRPLMGGTLARPSDRFPTVFTGQFWRKYPYFLPCVAPAIFVVVILLITAFFFQEVSLLLQA